MNVFDATPYFAAKRQWRERRRTDPTYVVVLLENMSVGELVHKLRGTGLAVSTRHGQVVLHTQSTPDSAA